MPLDTLNSTEAEQKKALETVDTLIRTIDDRINLPNRQYFYGYIIDNLNQLTTCLEQTLTQYPDIDRDELKNVLNSLLETRDKFKLYHLSLQKGFLETDSSFAARKQNNAELLEHFAQFEKDFHNLISNIKNAPPKLR